MFPAKEEEAASAAAEGQCHWAEGQCHWPAALLNSRDVTQ